MILCLAGIIWHFACLYFLGKLLLPNHWFERAIADMGMNMGVIASGLVLLRMVDPESKTPVPSDFAYKQLMHSPFMGGGLWTCTCSIKTIYIYIIFSNFSLHFLIHEMLLCI